MLFRVTACWLIVLVLAPFTAPFKTFDLSSPIGAPLSASIAVDSAPASVPVIAAAARMRLQPLSTVSRVSIHSSDRSTCLAASAARSTRIQQRTILTTILRV